MTDFILFKSFISTEVLIFFYYIGAVVLPFGTWYLAFWLIKKYNSLELLYKNTKKVTWSLLNKKQQTGVAAFFILLFLFAELFWRLLFEFMIAYIQIRDALVGA